MWVINPREVSEEDDEDCFWPKILVPQRRRRPRITKTKCGKKSGAYEGMSFNPQPLWGVQETGIPGSRFGVLEIKVINTPVVEPWEARVPVVQLNLVRHKLLYEQVRSLKAKIKVLFVEKARNGASNQRKVVFCKGNITGVNKANLKLLEMFILQF
ncbi:hypothetical protein O6P43_017026 [Quillaja saponaria]|uniref:Uncharacterized protein n=1 Tax=Quillaja saponaria TaxID=32244 RepID=A0AAD7LP97_QUISA|nr:hypothetical protein O6P43_017026 [Quillaja saponaria]